MSAANGDAQAVGLGRGSASDAVRTSKDEGACDVVEELNALQFAGSFASFGQIADFVDPQIHVNGVGNLPLPLNDGAAQALVGVCHDAPFGRGSETLVDKSVRKTWELNHDDFSIQNRHWQFLLDQIVARAVRELGLPIEPRYVEAELYKMLLYGKGAMFKPHKDSEKCPGMFGTLVICLPSPHKGGAVKLNHCGQEKMFQTSGFPQSYACWYSDVTHEVTEVTSGYRWVLTYNLKKTVPAADQSASTLRQNYRNLRAAMNQVKLPDNIGLIPLEHQHTDASLSFDSLRGKDLVKARALKEVCEQTGFSVYLANVEKRIDGEAELEDDDWREYDDDGYPREVWGGSHAMSDVADLREALELTTVIDLDNNRVGANVMVGDYEVPGCSLVTDYNHRYGSNVEVDRYFLGGAPFKDRKPDAEDFAGITGNEGAPLTHTYRNTVLVIMPRDHSMEFLLDPFATNRGYFSCRLRGGESFTFDQLLAVLHQRSRADTGDPSRQKDFLTACKFGMEHTAMFYDRRFSSAAILNNMLSASMMVGDAALFEQAVRLVGANVPFDMFPSGVAVLPAASLHLLRRGLEMAVFQIKPMQLRLYAISYINYRVRRHPTGAGQDDLIAWVASMTEETLSAQYQVTERDGKALVQVLPQLTGGIDVYLAQVKSIIRQNMSKTAFGTGFLLELRRAADANRIPQDASKALSRELLGPFLASLSLRADDQPQAQEPRYNSWGPMLFDAAPRPRPAPVTGELLWELFSMVLAHDDANLTRTLLWKVGVEMQQMDGAQVRETILPCLERLPATLAQHAWPNPPGFEKLYKTAIRAYQQRHVGFAGAAPDWSRAPAGCGCKNCQSLDRFLVHPDEKERRFLRLSNAARAHMQQQLAGHDVLLATDPGARALVVTKFEPRGEVGMGDWSGRYLGAVEVLRDLFASIPEPERLLGEDWELYSAEGMRAFLSGPLPPGVVPRVGGQLARPNGAAAERSLQEPGAGERPAAKRGRVDGVGFVG
ncbi:hypothetical protein K490DRAFT_65113 [Saccharata proteae CBS 121410]|uniref:Prolyl 4-hydroxylase alpha subunit Fe(2+) 2OG dioxygenase domain-containing protein n=1 Tax=Saccharata proteae CBS 121410 TaxID=1314787 RepID=A0A9P4HXS4_9PEZI|nr:hypothetical protein K490DRAFT_65113 [Saccharata proteae CBS 121410]